MSACCEHARNNSRARRVPRPRSARRRLAARARHGGGAPPEPSDRAISCQSLGCSATATLPEVMARDTVIRHAQLGCRRVALLVRLDLGDRRIRSCAGRARLRPRRARSRCSTSTARCRRGIALVSAVVDHQTSRQGAWSAATRSTNRSAIQGLPGSSPIIFSLPPMTPSSEKGENRRSGRTTQTAHTAFKQATWRAARDFAPSRKRSLSHNRSPADKMRHLPVLRRDCRKDRKAALGPARPLGLYRRAGHAGHHGAADERAWSADKPQHLRHDRAGQAHDLLGLRRVPRHELLEPVMAPAPVPSRPTARVMRTLCVEHSPVRHRYPTWNPLRPSRTPLT